MRIKHTTEVYFNNQLFHFRLASKQITAKQTATEEIELKKNLNDHLRRWCINIEWIAIWQRHRFDCTIVDDKRISLNIMYSICSCTVHTSIPYITKGSQSIPEKNVVKLQPKCYYKWNKILFPIWRNGIYNSQTLCKSVFIHFCAQCISFVYILL